MLVITNHLKKLEFEFQHLKSEAIKPGEPEDENVGCCRSKYNGQAIEPLFIYLFIFLKRKFLGNITHDI